MRTQTGPAAAGADLAQLSLDFHHTHQLLDPAAGVQAWEVGITAAGTPVGSLTAVRGLYWKSDNLRERMTDEQSFPALVAAQLLDDEGHFSYEFEEFIESASSVLVVDQLHLEKAFADPVVVAGVVAAVIDRLTDNYFAVVLPGKNACTDAGSALLAEAGTLLSAQEFSDELQIIDNALAAPEEAAQRVRSRLRSLARHGQPAAWDDEDEGEGDGWDEDGEEDEELTARTAAVLRVALEVLSKKIWQDVAAVGDAPLGRGEGRVLGSLPPITFHQDPLWRRQMARCFDDLAADLAETGTVRPLCTGEEMALHLGIDQAKSLTRNRPRLVAETVEGLGEDRRDFDWDWCSTVLFEDHDVLMLFDASLDGIEDSSNEINQALGLANLAAADWFEPFRTDQARDPDRGFRHS